jgi:hypothetical protein
LNFRCRSTINAEFIPDDVLKYDANTFSTSGAKLKEVQREVQGLCYMPREMGGNNMGNYYNGYSWKEREDNLKEMDRLIKKGGPGDPPPAKGPCAICGDTDPKAEFEYHSEDYSLPCIWVEPATYVLCRSCHRYKLHQRFARPIAWQAFLAHIRRGGYARDLKDPDIKEEVDAYSKALKNGNKPDDIPALKTISPYKRTIGEEWFARLRLDSESLTDPKARPRP